MGRKNNWSTKKHRTIPKDLTDKWTTVELRHDRQAQTIADALSQPLGVHIPPVVRNLRVHTVLQDPFPWDPPITGADKLADRVKDVATDLTAEGKLRCLAIDMTLLSEGWLVDSAARPSHVMLLTDEASPEKSSALSSCPKLLERTTHVVFEPLWHGARYTLPKNGLRGLFPKMQYLCIQMDASSDADEAIELVQELLGLRHLEQLVVCMWAAPAWYCSRNEPLWSALKEVAKSEEKLCVIPHGCSMEAEWQAMVVFWSTVFDLSEDEMEEKLEAINSDHGDDSHDDHLAQEGQDAEAPPLRFNDVLSFRENTPLVARGGTPWSDIAHERFDDLTIPGWPSAEEDFLNMLGA
ncbi:hypothetical protein EVJ58_g6550 [Rhodofomes roseus]|uniref:Uncharacterized protein n=1 Tax=Rhodofomes roseus TaxID=34475 RepID=A0A4Y9Y8L1_9APHY|nr:hypothetical protein EVJ58_g6550 [Rhodofomes roseus]